MESRPKILGKDISHYQSIIDFEALAQSGDKFLIHKATQGFTKIDTKFKARQPALRKTGLKLGWYHYLTGNGIQQADFFLDTVRVQENELLACDYEVAIDHSEAEAFVQRVYERTGQYCALYCSPATGILNRVKVKSILLNCPLWFARYSGNWAREPIIPLPFVNKHWTLWQYSGDGLGCEPHRIAGIRETNIDSNCFYSNDEEIFEKFWKFPNIPEAEAVEGHNNNAEPEPHKATEIES